MLCHVLVYPGYYQVHVLATDFYEVTLVMTSFVLMHVGFSFYNIIKIHCTALQFQLLWII